MLLPRSLDKSSLVKDYELDYLVLAANFREQKQVASASSDLPDIDRFYRNKLVRRGLLKIQELIWTLRRFKLELETTVARRRGSQDEPLAFQPILTSERIAGQPILFIDMTAVKNDKIHGGIGVATRALVAAALQERSAVPVTVVDGLVRLLTLDRVGAPAKPEKGDIYVVMDHYWNAFASYPDVLSAIRQTGVSVATCIYDLIPLDYPALIDRSLCERMSRYLLPAILGSDCIFTISQSSSNDIKRYLTRAGLPRKAAIPWFHLGYSAFDRCSNARTKIRDLFAADGRTFVCIGSMMPHKAHLVAVRAFEKLWDEGSTDRLIIFGRRSEDSPIDMSIRDHGEYNHHLFRIDDATDEEIDWVYRHADCLIQPSIVEGFGLPIIEANHAGLPIIASDIPIFREIGCESLVFFDACDAPGLAQKVREFDRASTSNQRTTSMTWPQSLAELRKILIATASVTNSATP